MDAPIYQKKKRKRNGCTYLSKKREMDAPYQKREMYAVLQDKGDTI